MTDRLELDQIMRAFPSEWVLLVDYETDANARILRGRVAAHDKDRVELHRLDRELDLDDAAYLYTGEASDDRSVLIL